MARDPWRDVARGCYTAPCGSVLNVWELPAAFVLLPLAAAEGHLIQCDNTLRSSLACNSRNLKFLMRNPSRLCWGLRQTFRLLCHCHESAKQKVYNTLNRYYWPVFWGTKMHEKEKIYRVCYAGLSLQTLIKDLSLPGLDSPAASQIFSLLSKLKNICF